MYIKDGNRCVYTFFPNGNWIKLQLGYHHQVLSTSISWSVSVLPLVCSITIIVDLIELVLWCSVGMGIAFGLVSYLWLGFIFNDTVIEITLTFAVSYLAYFTVCYLLNLQSYIQYRYTLHAMSLCISTAIILTGLSSD